MNALAGMTGSRLVTSSAGGEDDRGAAIQRRIEALAIGDREWHAITGIARQTLHRAIRNEPGTKKATYVAIEAFLDKLEAKRDGKPVALGSPPKPNVVRYEVQGVYGAKAIIVEGPVESIAELEASVDRILRRMAREQGDPDA